jgi:hypothetical protein
MYSSYTFTTLVSDGGEWSASRPGRDRIFPLAPVQTGSEAHPASCTMGTGGPVPLVKARPERDADHSPLSSA